MESLGTYESDGQRLTFLRIPLSSCSKALSKLKKIPYRKDESSVVQISAVIWPRNRKSCEKTQTLDFGLWTVLSFFHVSTCPPDQPDQLVEFAWRKRAGGLDAQLKKAIEYLDRVSLARAGSPKT
jgi:hypothetical protein